MTSRRVVYKRPSGTISVLCPSDRCLWLLEHGGGVVPYWPHRFGLLKWLEGTGRTDHCRPDGTMPLDLALEWEVHKLVRSEQWRPDRPDRGRIAEKWVRALAFGGAKGDDALWLIADKDCKPWGLGHQIVDVSDLPDARYRAAWRMSSNGGPVWIDDDVARKIDEMRAWEVYDAERDEGAQLVRDGRWSGSSRPGAAGR